MKKKPTPSDSSLKLWIIKANKAVASLSSSFWFLPASFILIALILALYILPLLANIFIDAGAFASFGISNKQTAMSLVQVIASSLITVTSIAFSMTIVALVMASNSFGPRLIRSFMQSKKTQFVLGFFSASFVYCLIVISQIRPESSQMDHPVLSVLFALILAVMSVFFLIFFIHHVAVSIRADTVVDDISRSLLKDMQKLQNNQGRRVIAEFGINSTKQYSHKCLIKTQAAGYILAIEYEKLAQLASQYNGLMEMQMRAGKYIYPDTELAIMYSDEVLPKELCIDQSIVTGSQRTPLQDPQFAINQLVEMALRALSPSMNDPFTAISCIDKLIAALAGFNEKNLPKTLIVDNQQTARVLTMEESFDELFAGAFTQIRQASIQQNSVLCHLLDVFYRLLVAKQRPEHLIKPIQTQVTAIEQSLTLSNIVLNDVDKVSVSDRITCIVELIDVPDN